MTKLQSVKIVDLIQVLKEHYDSRSKVKTVGIRPGEKIDEWLLNEDEASRAFEVGEDFVVVPQIDRHNVGLNYSHLHGKSISFKYYSSSDNLISKQELKEFFSTAGILK